MKIALPIFVTVLFLAGEVKADITVYNISTYDLWVSIRPTSGDCWYAPDVLVYAGITHVFHTRKVADPCSYDVKGTVSGTLSSDTCSDVPDGNSVTFNYSSEGTCACSPGTPPS